MIHEVYGHIIEIWEPRYKDKKALIGRHHVMDGVNYITFTRAAHLKDKVFLVDSNIIRSCHLQANGRGEVYCVPMSSLKLAGYLSDTKAPEIKVTNSMIAGYLKQQGVTVIECGGEEEPVYVQGKRNNILVTVQPDTVHFDRFVKNGRTFVFREIDYALPWRSLADISLDKIPEEAAMEQQVMSDDVKEQETKNPLMI